MKDVREHELKPMTLRIGIEMTVYALGDPKGFLGNTSDEIAQLMTHRFETASVVTHVKTTEWDFSLSGGDAAFDPGSYDNAVRGVGRRGGDAT